MSLVDSYGFYEVGRHIVMDIMPGAGHSEKLRDFIPVGCSPGVHDEQKIMVDFYGMYRKDQTFNFTTFLDRLKHINFWKSCIERSSHAEKRCFLLRACSGGSILRSLVHSAS